MDNQKYCVYITQYSGNLFPQNYIGSTSINKINNGYKGSVKSKQYKVLWESELKYNPHLFSLQIISYHDTRSEAIFKELQLQKIFNVVKNPLFINMSYASPNGFFGRDTSKENHPLFAIPRSIDTKNKISKNHANVSGENNPMYNSIRITNGSINSISYNIDSIPEGWKRGITIKKKRAPETKPRGQRKKEIHQRSTKGKNRRKFLCVISNKKEYDKTKAKIYFPELPY